MSVQKPKEPLFRIFIIRMWDATLAKYYMMHELTLFSLS